MCTHLYASAQAISGERFVNFAAPLRSNLRSLSTVPTPKLRIQPSTHITCTGSIVHRNLGLFEPRPLGCFLCCTVLIFLGFHLSANPIEVKVTTKTVILRGFSHQQATWLDTSDYRDGTTNPAEFSNFSSSNNLPRNRNFEVRMRSTYQSL